MQDPSPTWLVRADGTRLRVGPAGCLIGRSAVCDLVLASVEVHAVVVPYGAGIEVVVTAPSPAVLDGGRETHRARLGNGDSFELGGERLTVRSDEAASTWARLAVRIADGGTYGLRRLPTTIGGAPDDTVSNPRWPIHAARFTRRGAYVVAQLAVDGTVDGAPTSADHRVTLTPGTTVVVGALRFEIAELSDGDPVLPSAIRLVHHRAGAVLNVWRSPAERPLTVELSELRTRLVGTLLVAGADAEVLDERLISELWSGDLVRTRLDVNQLVHRTRRALCRVGLDGAAILVRRPTGGATTLRLAPGATIEIR